MIISVNQLIGNTLNTRDEAQKLFEHLSSHYDHSLPVTFNFDGVYFMSRSFADEFHKLKVKWGAAEHNNASVGLENADMQIIEILQAVSRTQGSRVITNSQPTLLTFTNNELLSDFLQSL